MSVVDPASLPARQFTAGAIAKETGATLVDVRTELDALVASGVLTVKVAKSGARNYSRTKAGATQATAPVTPVPVDERPVREMSRSDRVAAAKDEAKAVKAWKAAGSPAGSRPATPNLDAMSTDAHPEAKRKATAKKREPKAVTRGTTVQFLHDDKPMAASQNKLSSVAWYHTKGSDPKDPTRRLSVDELRALLTAAGVETPERTQGWSVTLPNKVVLSTV